jgi:uncharacterized Tic20 family protein
VQQGKSLAVVSHLGFLACWFVLPLVIRLTAGSGFGTPGFFVGEGLLGLVNLGIIAFAIVGAVRASQGVWWRYPISIRFVPGARPRAA